MKRVILVFAGPCVVAVIDVPSSSETEAEKLAERVAARIPKGREFHVETRNIVEAAAFDMWADIHYGKVQS